jgi:hypothetical protein
MVNQPNVDTPSPRAVTLARIWLLVLGFAWVLAGLSVGSTVGGSHWSGLILVAVGALHFTAARFARKLAVLASSFGP